MRFMFTLAGLGLALAISAPGKAEVFEMDGHFPAPFREVSLARSIGIDRIGGRDGMALSLALERLLSRRGPDGRPHFDLIALSRNGPDAEVIVSGMADATIRKSDVKRTVEECADKQASICPKKEKVDITCTQEVVSFSSTLRVARPDDGRILYTQTRPQSDTIVTCPKDKSPRHPKDSIDRMVRTAADRFVDDIVPRHERYRIRLREGRDGMDKAMGQAFRDSIRLSQRDPAAACEQWDGMNRDRPGHPSLLFNLGLCAERDSDYAQAERLYAQAGKAQEDIDRVRDLTIGREDAQARAADQ